MSNQERTVIKGFHNRGCASESNKPEPMVDANNESDEGTNVTWMFWTMAGVSVAALVMSIISLVLVCQ